MTDDRVQAFWEQVRRRPGDHDGAAGGEPPQAWSFGDTPELADELLALVLAGVKTATAATVWECEADGEPVPRSGDLSIVLDGAGEPRALIRTTAVEVVPFDRVGEDHAHLEGEGDRTLADWRAGHEAHWRRTLPPIGREFALDMPIACERFEVLYPES